MTSFKEIDEARKILTLGETATQQEIKDAYRRLVLKYHPDRSDKKNREEDANDFKKITAAYEIIIDYCKSYRYSFKRRDIEGDSDKEKDEQHLKNFYDGWLTDTEI